MYWNYNMTALGLWSIQTKLRDNNILFSIICRSVNSALHMGCLRKLSWIRLRQVPDVFQPPSWQWPARVSILENSRDFFWKFTSRSRFWVIWFSLSLLEKSEGRKFFTFHFSKMVKSFHISLFLLRKMSGIECNSSWIDWEFVLHQQLNSSILIFGSFKIQQRTIQKSVFFWTLLSQIMNLISKLLVKSRLLSAKRAEATEFTTRCMCWKEAVTKNSNFATLVYCQG